MTDMAWLSAWSAEMAAAAVDRRVLELGCGSGRDTEVLVRSGYDVVAIDLSPEAIAEARQRAPLATFLCQDVRAPLPEAARGVGVVIASLSLHYFPWEETVKAVAQVHAHLAPGGLFLCRMNSTEDFNFGARGHPEIAHHFHLVDGKPKRFFDRADMLKLFGSQWRLLRLTEKTIDRYERPKRIWEAGLTKE